MELKDMARAVLAAALGLASVGAIGQARAGTSDYAFELTQDVVKKGEGTILSVRLIDKRSGKLVPDAVIIAKRVDMAPDGMIEMVEPIEQLPSTEPGIYRFKAALVMAGGWRLSLGAKLQGEAGTLEEKLVFKAVP